jgi:hypothetical protein
MYFTGGPNFWTYQSWVPVPPDAPPTALGLFQGVRLSNDQAHGYLHGHVGEYTAFSFLPGEVQVAPIPTNGISFIELLEGGAYFLGVKAQVPYVAAGFGTLGPFEVVEGVGLGFVDVDAVLDDGVHAVFVYDAGGNEYDNVLTRIEDGLIVDQRPFSLSTSRHFSWEQHGTCVYAIPPILIDDLYHYQVWGMDLSDPDAIAQPMSPTYLSEEGYVHYSVAGHWFIYPSGGEWYLVHSTDPGAGSIVEWGDNKPGDSGHRAVARL